jgi:hypothetical protein
LLVMLPRRIAAIALVACGAVEGTPSPIRYVKGFPAPPRPSRWTRPDLTSRRNALPVPACASVDYVLWSNVFSTCVCACMHVSRRCHGSGLVDDDDLVVALNVVAFVHQSRVASTYQLTLPGMRTLVAL